MADLIKITRDTTANFTSKATQVYENGTILYNQDKRALYIADGTAQLQNLPVYTGVDVPSTITGAYTITDDDISTFILDGTARGGFSNFTNISR
ncbi:MAG: hypothetical protein OMM_14864 [Candidatus Magnetoglobus multicellularis str. Araruama]|uniref:Uncharacterized protein n=1 Tax=Candidatus Magnetoglobus multicellularis str. Araruama TaxID=890399 RepID=A0A1V1NR56_9BACT|nr:MAG: hypothetical protein OMM_14864 [Candidatus Magnetoglobus multicellularis str. Araruama]